MSCKIVARCCNHQPRTSYLWTAMRTRTYSEPDRNEAGTATSGTCWKQRQRRWAAQDVWWPLGLWLVTAGGTLMLSWPDLVWLGWLYRSKCLKTSPSTEVQLKFEAFKIFWPMAQRRLRISPGRADSGRTGHAALLGWWRELPMRYPLWGCSSSRFARGPAFSELPSSKARFISWYFMIQTCYLLTFG